MTMTMTKTMQLIMNELNEQKERNARITCGVFPEPEFIAVGVRQCEAAKKLGEMGLVTLRPWENSIFIRLK